EIINDTCIYGVGAVYLNDSLGNTDPDAYNTVHWDGYSWEVKRIRYYGSCSAVEYPPIKAIWAFSENNIAITNGGSVAWFDGDKLNLDCEVNPLLNGAINKIWGISSNDLYIVGNNGTIVHYNGQNWQKVESGTDIDLRDIYGTPDGKTIWACGWSNNTGQTIVLEIENQKVNTIWDSKNSKYPYSGLINSLWTFGDEFIFGGNSLFRHSIKDKNDYGVIFVPTPFGEAQFQPGSFIWKIRGDAKNNLFLCGDNGMVWHYNGKSWHKFNELFNETFDRRLFSIAAKGNIVVTVGWLNTQAWIAVGKR
ncbi:MAG: hypothetical protein ABI550_09475, partial [Ignavibacteriaceae bacterium]